MRFVLLGGLGYGALNYAFLFPALKFTTAAAATIAIELYMPFSIIMSIIFLGERIGRYRILGVCIAFLGVIVLAFSKPGGEIGPYFALGIGMIAMAALAESVGAVGVKKTKNIHPFTLLMRAIIGSYHANPCIGLRPPVF